MTKFSAVATEMNYTAGDAKTLLQVVAASDKPIHLREMGVSFNGVTSADEPSEVQLCRQDDAGTSSAVTPRKDNEDDSNNLGVTARGAFTAEPTTTTAILRSWYVHGQAGLVMRFDAGEVVCGSGNRLAIRILCPSGVTSMDAHGYMAGDE